MFFKKLFLGAICFFSTELLSIPPIRQSGVFDFLGLFRPLNLSDDFCKMLSENVQKKLDANPLVQRYLNSHPELTLLFSVIEGKNMHEVSEDSINAMGLQIARDDKHRCDGLIKLALKRMNGYFDKIVRDGKEQLNGYLGVVEYSRSDGATESFLGVKSYLMCRGPKSGHLALLTTNPKLQSLYFRASAGRLFGPNKSIVLKRDGLVQNLQLTLGQILSNNGKQSGQDSFFKRSANRKDSLEVGQREFFESIERLVFDGHSVALAIVFDEIAVCDRKKGAIKSEKVYFLRADTVDSSFAVRLVAGQDVLSRYQDNWFILLPPSLDGLPEEKSSCVALATVAMVGGTERRLTNLGQRLIARIADDSSFVKVEFSDSELNIDTESADQIRGIPAPIHVDHSAISTQPVARYGKPAAAGPSLLDGWSCRPPSRKADSGVSSCGASFQGLTPSKATDTDVPPFDEPAKQVFEKEPILKEFPKFNFSQEAEGAFLQLWRDLRQNLVGTIKNERRIGLHGSFCSILSERFGQSMDKFLGLVELFRNPQYFQQKSFDRLITKDLAFDARAEQYWLKLQVGSPWGVSRVLLMLNPKTRISLLFIKNFNDLVRDQNEQSWRLVAANVPEEAVEKVSNLLREHVEE